MTDLVTPLVSLLIAGLASLPGFVFYLRHLRGGTDVISRELEQLRDRNFVLQGLILDLSKRLQLAEDNLQILKEDYDVLTSSYNALRAAVRDK